MDRTIEKNVLCVHIRLADCNVDNYNYFKNTIDKVLSNINIKKIYICSAGLEHQKQDIITSLINKNNYKKYNVELLFNYDTIETFKIMMKSHILIASQIGSLSKTLGYFSDNIKIYQPLNIEKECLQNKCSPEIFGGFKDSYNTNDVILGKFANKWMEANENGIINDDLKKYFA
jgi:D-ribose pyranose/furanose isomerase RbsD